MRTHLFYVVTFSPYLLLPVIGYIHFVVLFAFRSILNVDCSPRRNRSLVRFRDCNGKVYTYIHIVYVANVNKITVYGQMYEK